MKVFISWSGDLSRDVAIVFRDWLPSVIQSIDPYVSSEDIDKGTRWSSDISGELEASNFGLLCVTPNNLQAPWINFEAGALSKSVDSSRVSPFLFNVKRSEVTGPLIQFQSTINEKEDIFKLVNSINEAEEKKLPLDRLRTIFDVWWPQLEKALKALSEQSEKDSKKSSPERKKEPEILEEVLDLMRSQAILLRDPEKLFPRAYFDSLTGGSESRIYRRKSLEGPVRHLNQILNKLKQRASEGHMEPGEVHDFIDELEGPTRYLMNEFKLSPFA